MPAWLGDVATAWRGAESAGDAPGAWRVCGLAAGTVAGSGNVTFVYRWTTQKLVELNWARSSGVSRSARSPGTALLTARYPATR